MQGISCEPSRRAELELTASGAGTIFLVLCLLRASCCSLTCYCKTNKFTANNNKYITSFHQWESFPNWPQPQIEPKT